MHLIADSPWPGLPAQAGPLRLAAREFPALTLIQPLPGRDASDALRAAAGVGLPMPGRTEAAGAALIVCFGWDESLLLGPAVEVAGAVCIDQSDAWTALGLAGEVRGVLARLCPLDLREPHFPDGATARSLLERIPISLTRFGADDWLLLVPRSMAQSALALLVHAAEGLAARG